MNSYDIYLFDLDGTLVDTEKALHFVFDESYKKVGVKVNESHIKRLMRIQLFQGYKELNAPNDDNMKKIFGDSIIYYLDHQKTMELTEIFDDTYELFKTLKENNKTIGVVTSNNKKHTTEVLNKFGLLDFVSVIIGNQETKNHKPAPDPILEGLRQLNYSGDLNKVVYVGDGLNDMESATNAKAKCYLLDRFNEYTNISEYTKIKTLKEISDAFIR